MERLKRSLSFRKRKGRVPECSKPHQWQEDEHKVREGTCSFQVRYLGCIEVFESRGIQVCEEAVKVLKTRKNRSVWSRMSLRRKKDSKQCKGKYQRAILYVSGDALRVVDEISKDLIVDQTIEKVSFCAPDRNHEKGFAYICRDGTTRRWICHGFLALKESGERLSHAVGCAFAICLEKKQKREKDSVSVTYNDKGTSFTRTGSFRQTTLTERLEDPQSAFLAEPVPLASADNPFAVQRPHATDAMLERQGSFRGFSKLSSASPFKRQLSLRLNELPSTLDRQNQLNQAAAAPQCSNGLASPIAEVSPSKEHSDNIASMCQQLSVGLSQLTDDTHSFVSDTQHQGNVPPAAEPSATSKRGQWASNRGVSDADRWLHSMTSSLSSGAPPAAHGMSVSAQVHPAARSQSVDATQKGAAVNGAAVNGGGSDLFGAQPFDGAWQAKSGLGGDARTNPFQSADVVTKAFEVKL